jgi:septum formation protein
MPQSSEIILASSSPRRRDLLREAGYRFRVVVPSEGVEGPGPADETPLALVLRLAYQKAADVAKRLTAESALEEGGRAETGHSTIVACDTVVECDGAILGKPSDEAHARRMLSLLSGRRHCVYSGLCVWRPPRESEVRAACTTLRARSISSGEIDDYLATGLWQGKAGAFGYQDRLDWLAIEQGSESNVVGLPLELLAEMLAAVDC